MILIWLYKFKRITRNDDEIIFGCLSKTITTSKLDDDYDKYVKEWTEQNKTRLIIIKGRITQEISEKIIEFFHDLENVTDTNTNTNIDIILDTFGGKAGASMKIQDIIMQYSGTIRVYVPVHAESGGTIISLGTKNLFANKLSNFSPFDFQIDITTPKLRVSKNQENIDENLKDNVFRTITIQHNNS
jgi:Serine dehydrogenase proteinase